MMKRSAQFTRRKHQDVLYVDFSKTFAMVFHCIHTSKLVRNGLATEMIRRVENCLDCQAQRVVISGTKSSLKPFTSGIPLVSILGPILFGVFIRDLESFLSKFTDDIKLSGVADMLR